MELLNFLYNILLLLVYSIPLTLGFILYLQRKKHIYLYTCILFIAFIVDNVTIYMTEFLPWFSRLYDHMLLSVPTIKTILYAVTLGCMLLILTALLNKKQRYSLWICLVFIIFFQLYTPLIPNGPWKVWIYYFPAQLFMFCIGLYGIYVKKQDPASSLFDPGDCFYRVLIFYTIMAAAITIEDSIVIFHFDVYTPLEIEIRKRSLTQDLMNIGLTMYAIRLLYTKLSNALAAACYEMKDTAGQDVSAPSGFAESPPSRLDLFVKEYQFTAREQEILLLLLENKNNQEISDILMISIGTTKAHIHNIFQKLEIRKRQQLLDLYQNFVSKE